jgi:hypothetical protein
VTGEQYLAAVEAWLGDLPWRVRKNLAADLLVHLGEIPAGEDLVARLGSPEKYAAELRAAAGLTSRRGPLAYLRARRPRNVVIAVALLGVAGGLAAAVAWASTYQPLSTGSIAMSPNPSRGGALNETVAEFRNGKPFELGFSIRNDGRFSVHILRIPLHDGFNRPFAVRVFVGSPGSDPNTALPFHPFTLRPGSERLIILRGTYANCGKYVANTSTTFLSMPVRTRFCSGRTPSRSRCRSPSSFTCRTETRASAVEHLVALLAS